MQPTVSAVNLYCLLPCPACWAMQASLLPGLLTALAYKLIAAEDSAMVQSLLCVLAQLLHADQQQLLDCLAGIQLRWVAYRLGRIAEHVWSVGLP